MNTKCKLSDSVVIASRCCSEQSREQQRENGVKKAERSVHNHYIRSKAHWSEVSIPTLQRLELTQGSNFDSVYSGNNAPSIEHKQISLLDNVLTQNFSRRETESNDGRHRSDPQAAMFQEYKLPEELGNIKINKTGEQLVKTEIFVREGEDYYNPVWNKLSDNIDTIIADGKKSNSINISESVSIEQDDSELFGSFRSKTETKPQRKINDSVNLEFYDINSDTELNSKINLRREKRLNYYEIEFVTPKRSVGAGDNKCDPAVLQVKECRTPGTMRSWQTEIFDKRNREMLEMKEKDHTTEREFERNHYLVKKKDSASKVKGNWDGERDDENVRKDHFITKDGSVKHNAGRMEYDYAGGDKHNFRNETQVTSEIYEKLYHLDEEEGELSEVKEQAQEFKKLSMIVNVISCLREMHDVNYSFVKSSSDHWPKNPDVSGKYGFDDVRGNKLLRDALESGRINEVKNVVLNHLNIDINLRSQSGCSSLHKTAAEGDIEGLRFLIEHHADLDVGDRAGFPPVHHALQRYHYKAAIFLMDRGTNLTRYTSKRIQEFLKVKVTAKQYLRQNLKTAL